MNDDNAWEKTLESGCAGCDVLDIFLETGCDEAWGCEEDRSDLLVAHGCDTGVEVKLA